MTAKQKKNLRKKLYRKRKKLESQNNSKLDMSSNQSMESEERKSSTCDADDEDEEEETATEPNLEINMDDVAIGGPKVAANSSKPETTEAKKKTAKKKAVTESLERLEPELVNAKLNGELSGDNKDSSAAEAAN